MDRTLKEIAKEASNAFMSHSTRAMEIVYGGEKLSIKIDSVNDDTTYRLNGILIAKRKPSTPTKIMVSCHAYNDDAIHQLLSAIHGVTVNRFIDDRQCLNHILWLGGWNQITII